MPWMPLDATARDQDTTTGRQRVRVVGVMTGGLKAPGEVNDVR